MPDERNLQRIERVLRELQEKATEELERYDQAALAPPLDGAVGRVSRMDAHQQRQMVEHGKRRVELQLERIRGALDRVHDGTYGDCVFCNRPIAEARLQAAPETPSCTECQARLEREGRA